MPAFIVRRAGTKDIIGFYAAEDMYELHCLIDEECDPSDFECSEVSGGYGIEFRRRGRKGRIRAGHPEDLDKIARRIDRIYVTEGLAMALMEKGGRWRPIY